MKRKQVEGLRTVLDWLNGLVVGAMLICTLIFHSAGRVEMKLICLVFILYIIHNWRHK